MVPVGARQVGWLDAGEWSGLQEEVNDCLWHILRCSSMGPTSLVASACCMVHPFNSVGALSHRLSRVVISSLVLPVAYDVLEWSWNTGVVVDLHKFSNVSKQHDCWFTSSPELLFCDSMVCTIRGISNVHPLFATGTSTLPTLEPFGNRSLASSTLFSGGSGSSCHHHLPNEPSDRVSVAGDIVYLHRSLSW